MAITFKELQEKLALQDEVTILELLDIKSHELVEVFADKIEARFSYIRKELDE